jgi:disulfide bond formation protein DsbB
MLQKILDRQFFLTSVGTMAFLCLVTAFIAEYYFDIIPCHLCIYERYCYAALVIIGAGGGLRFHSILYYAATFLILIGLGLSIYHLGVEYHWWQVPQSCITTSISAGNFDDFEAQFMKKSVARCDQVTWVIFGVSATFWNLLLFCVFGLYALICSSKK